MGLVMLALLNFTRAYCFLSFRESVQAIPVALLGLDALYFFDINDHCIWANKRGITFFS